MMHLMMKGIGCACLHARVCALPVLGHVACVGGQVYAKDDVPPMTFHPEDDEQLRAIESVGQRLGSWEYAVAEGSAAFAEELGEYVKKFQSVSFA